MGWRERLPAAPYIHFMAAAPLDAWVRLLLTPGVRIGWRYWPRVLVNVGLSACVTVITLPERVVLAPVLWWRGRRSGWRLGEGDGETGVSRGSALDAAEGEVEAAGGEHADRRLPSPALPSAGGDEGGGAPAIVVLGYYRSGTTHLHNLLACDPGNYAPRWVQMLSPQGFVVSWFVLKLFLWAVLPTKRPQDDMAFGPEWPGEDDFALSNWTLASPLCGRVVVPGAWEHFRRFHDLEGLTDRERARWRRAQWAVLWKAAVLARGRRLVIKTPPHTARVEAIGEVLGGAPASVEPLGTPPAWSVGGRAPGGSPGSASEVPRGEVPSERVEHADRRLPSPALPPETGTALGTRERPKFIHLSRHPAAVLKSNERLMKALTPFHLQDSPGDAAIRERLIDDYDLAERRYLEAEPSIPAGGVVRMRYEDLIADPIGELRRAYAGLGIEWTQGCERRVGAYLASVREYRSETQKLRTVESAGPAAAPERLAWITSEFGHDRPAAPAAPQAPTAPAEADTSAAAASRQMIAVLALPAGALCAWWLIAWGTGHRWGIFAWMLGIAIGLGVGMLKGSSPGRGMLAAALAALLAYLGVVFATYAAISADPEVLVPQAAKYFMHESTLLWTGLGALSAFRLASRRFGAVPGAWQ